MGIGRAVRRIDALGVCRERCWRNDWVLDMDIRKFFDTVPWDLVLKAVAHHTDQRWILLYVERWLKAPLQREDGSLVERDRGTPQGSAISPLLANMFMHYAFDAWMAREFPAVQFERYCDDVIVQLEASGRPCSVRAVIAARLAECGLELNEHKTRIVYCKDADRRGSYEHTSFDFLGYTFRPRLSKSRFGKHFVNFSPAVSSEAKTRCGARCAAGGRSPLGQGPHGPGAHVQPPSSRAGSTTTDASTSPCCIRSSATSTTRS